MRVKVRPLQVKGRSLLQKELRDLPPHVGLLKVAEARDYDLSRPLVRARLLDIMVGTETDVLPELLDARLLWAEGSLLRLTGFERIGDASYAQTWSVEVA